MFSRWLKEKTSWIPGLFCGDWKILDEKSSSKMGSLDLWRINLPPLTYPPQKKSPYDQGLLTYWPELVSVNKP